MYNGHFTRISPFVFFATAAGGPLGGLTALAADQVLWRAGQRFERTAIGALIGPNRLRVQAENAAIDAAYNAYQMTTRLNNYLSGNGSQIPADS